MLVTIVNVNNKGINKSEQQISMVKVNDKSQQQKSLNKVSISDKSQCLLSLPVIPWHSPLPSSVPFSYCPGCSLLKVLCFHKGHQLFQYVMGKYYCWNGNNTDPVYDTSLSKWLDISTHVIYWCFTLTEVLVWFSD